MEMIGFIAALGVGIAIGMYITTRIAETIDKNVRSKQFFKDLNNLDKKKKHGTR